MADYIQRLRHEFEAGEGSFLIRLRVDMDWDKGAFNYLVSAMHKCCLEHEGAETIERWMAGGFWYLQDFVRDWSSHPNFSRPYATEYYEKAYNRLDDLAYWFFLGYSPYRGEQGFEPLD